MARLTKPVVLIVDDDSGHRLMLSIVLESWGYRVEQAEDGRKAVHFIRAHSADLILMDMRMPNMDGIETTREIRRCNPAVPVIIMTAHFPGAAISDAAGLGVLACLSKPLDFSALKSLIDRALEHSLPNTNEAVFCSSPNS